GTGGMATRRRTLSARRAGCRDGEMQLLSRREGEQTAGRAAAEGPARNLSGQAAARLAVGRTTQRLEPDDAGDRGKIVRPGHFRACHVSCVPTAASFERRGGAINCFLQFKVRPNQITIAGELS